jgi:acyl-CoA thioesterase FadM
MIIAEIPEGFSRHNRSRTGASRPDDVARRQCNGIELRQKARRQRAVGQRQLAIDFIGPAKVGQWLQVETEAIKTGSTLCFAQCLATADGMACARASASFNVAKTKH